MCDSAAMYSLLRCGQMFLRWVWQPANLTADAADPHWVLTNQPVADYFKWALLNVCTWLVMSVNSTKVFWLHNTAEDHVFALNHPLLQPISK